LKAIKISTSRSYFYSKICNKHSNLGNSFSTVMCHRIL